MAISICFISFRVFRYSLNIFSFVAVFVSMCVCVRACVVKWGVRVGQSYVYVLIM